MQEIILDTVFDCLKILPFLFIAFLIIEFFEHKLSHKTEKTIKKAQAKPHILRKVNAVKRNLKKARTILLCGI